MTLNAITLPRNEHWRLTPRVVGEIHALPGSNGILTATNGILCYIERAENSLFLGHIDHFISRTSPYFVERVLKLPSKVERHTNPFDKIFNAMLETL